MKRQLFFLTCMVLLGGCGGYPLRYSLSEQNIHRSSSTVSLDVEAVTLVDGRPDAEQTRRARRQRGDADSGDYTYDEQFDGNVAEELSSMLTRHLDYAGVFASITRGTLRADSLTPAVLDELQMRGIDAVLTGEISHFYGYYDEREGRQLLYALGLGTLGFVLLYTPPSQEDILSGGAALNNSLANLGMSLGTSMGYYLESRHKRRVESRTVLSLRLVSTRTEEVLWEDSIEVREEDQRAMPGLQTHNRKFEVAMASLREAANEVTRRLSRIQIASRR